MAMTEKQVNEILDSPKRALKLNDEQLDAAVKGAGGGGDRG